MRHKFRIWDKTNFRFIYPTSISFNEDGSLGSCFERRKNQVTRSVHQAKELQVSTGKEDIHGKELFEGDIIRSSNQALHYIKYSKASLSLVILPCEHNDYYYTGRGIAHIKEFFDFEIVGNVYQNGNLIEVGQ